MTQPTAIAATAPMLAEPILSPRRARLIVDQQPPAPFLVDRRESGHLTASRPDVAAEPAPAEIRLVLRGVARRPILTAWIAALAGMTAIGLFLGLMLGNLAG